MGSDKQEWVDLGLPSGVKWAVCNLGASAPSDPGKYYSWGEIAGKPMNVPGNSKTSGKQIGNISGLSGHDAARAEWGGNWRIPTKQEWEELTSKCKWAWVRNGKIMGYKVIGPNGKSIFLPACGSRKEDKATAVGKNGYYWSSTPDGKRLTHAYQLFFRSGGRHVVPAERFYGRPIRPVMK